MEFSTDIFLQITVQVGYFTFQRKYSILSSSSYVKSAYQLNSSRHANLNVSHRGTSTSVLRAADRYPGQLVLMCPSIQNYKSYA